jgi:hypothetical protein
MVITMILTRLTTNTSNSVGAKKRTQKKQAVFYERPPALSNKSRILKGLRALVYFGSQKIQESVPPRGSGWVLSARYTVQK